MNSTNIICMCSTQVSDIGRIRILLAVFLDFFSKSTITCSKLHIPSFEFLVYQRWQFGTNLFEKNLLWCGNKILFKLISVISIRYLNISGRSYCLVFNVFTPLFHLSEMKLGCQLSSNSRTLRQLHSKYSRFFSHTCFRLTIEIVCYFRIL